jgi:hypothetical protein
VVKRYRHAVLDRISGQWIESPAMDDEKEAQESRMHAFQQRFAELTGKPE